MPSSEGIITALEKIVKAPSPELVEGFEDTIQVQLIKERWVEIKTLQKPALTLSV